MIQMAEGGESGGGLLSTEQTDLLEEMISEKLSSISNRYDIHHPPVTTFTTALSNKRLMLGIQCIQLCLYAWKLCM